jgi:hypothetical protein
MSTQTLNGARAYAFRAADRFRAGAPASIETADSTHHLRILDISVGGLMAELPSLLTAGSNILIHFSDTLSVPASVTWVSEDRFGAEFHRPIGWRRLLLLFQATADRFEPGVLA